MATVQYMSILHKAMWLSFVAAALGTVDSLSLYAIEIPSCFFLPEVPSDVAVRIQGTNLYCKYNENNFLVCEVKKFPTKWKQMF